MYFYVINSNISVLTKLTGLSSTSVSLVNQFFLYQRFITLE